MGKLKKRSNLHANLQNVVAATINDPSYSFSLPKLSDWDSVVSSSANEKQRLEFVGDAIMHLSVALHLYHLFPDGTPGLYSNIRSALNTNATFTHLMVKAGAYDLLSQSHATKAVADSFEVIVAALYLERGFGDVCAWVQEQYSPLIVAARESYDRCLRSTPDPNVPRKRNRDHVGTSSLKKIRQSSGRSSPRRTLMAQRVINRMKSKGKIKLCLPARKSKPPLEMRLHSYKLRTSESRRPSNSSPVIDLTVEVDSDDERAMASSATHVPRHNLETPGLSQSRFSSQESDTDPQSDQSPDECAAFHSPLDSSSASSLPRLRSSPGPSLPPTLPPVAAIVSQPDYRSLCRRNPSPSSQLDSIHIDSGTYGNPIIIEDSDSES